MQGVASLGLVNGAALTLIFLALIANTPIRNYTGAVV